MYESLSGAILLGFVAQFINGSMGMGYGTLSSAYLLGTGVPPLVTSSSVHVSEIFINGVSGLSHIRLKNINKELVRKLAIPGAIGGVLGACLLGSISADYLKPFVALYLLVIGLVMTFKALSKLRKIRSVIITNSKEQKRIPLLPLALTGGCLDALGGGGWGMTVTSTLLAEAHYDMVETVGSVTLARFFVTLFDTSAFLILVKLTHWRIIVGLIVGGSIASPIAAYLCRLMPARLFMVAVGLFIIVASTRMLWVFFSTLTIFK